MKTIKTTISFIESGKGGGLKVANLFIRKKKAEKIINDKTNLSQTLNHFALFYFAAFNLGKYLVPLVCSKFDSAPYLYDFKVLNKMVDKS